MSEDTEELLTGRAGEESRQGFEPMPMANPDPAPEPAIDSDSAIAKHLERPAPPEPVERAYHDAQTGNRRAPNETVEIDRAAEDLGNIRAAENLELEKQHNSDLNQALDFLQQEQSALAAAAAPQPVDEQVTGRTEPDYTPQPDPEHALAADPNIDPEIAAALQNPKVRSLLEGVNQTVEQTKSQYQEQVAHAGMTAVASFVAAFPELAGLQADQLPGALALINQTNPARAQEIATHYNRVNGLVQQMQQVSAQTAQQRNEVASAQFKQFAVVSDHRFDSLNAHVPAETMKAIKTEAVAMLKEYGLSDADLAREYNSNPLFRSAAGQQIIADATRFRLSQKGLSQRRANPVPHLQRPGISEPSGRNDDGAVSAALARLNAPGGSEGRIGLKNAAALVAARRGNRR